MTSDPDAYLTAGRPINKPRWRVRDNLPGMRDYCPLVLRSERVRQAEQYDCAQQLASLEAEFGAQVADDGVRFNLRFDAYDDALPAWRCPDMTDHVEYLAEIVKLTFEQEMRKEAGYLRSLRLARERVKEVIEGPDTDIDRIIRSVRDNGDVVSNKLAGEFPMLGDEAVAARIVEAIRGAFVRT